MFNLINSKHNIPYLNKEYERKSPYSSNVYNSILDFIGNTPLIKLNKIPKDHGLSCEIYAKCEYLNPGGSIKDRIALAMLKDAESKGYVKENTEFVEPTSGNTGIGVAFNATLTEKKCIIVTGEKNSSEKVNTMRLLGAEVIVTNKSDIAVARQIKDENPDTVVMLDQFENQVNPRIHYDTTGVEIIKALDKVDMFVAGAGTGGTVSGTGHKIKENYPECKIIVAEPDGSIMFNTHGKSHPFLVEGIGGSYIPIVLDKSIVDGYEVVTDEESFLMAREVIRKEGLLCGGSSGTAMAAAIKAARKYQLGEGHRIVVILPDSIRNYMSKFVSEEWMEAYLFKDPPEHTMRWWKHPVIQLRLNRPCLIQDTATCSDALKEMKNQSLAVVVDSVGSFVGAFSKDAIRYSATNPTKLPGKNSEDINFNDPVTKHLVKDCYTLAKNGKKGMPSIGLLSRILDITSFVVIGHNVYEKDQVLFIPENVATADDVLDYIYSNSS